MARLEGNEVLTEVGTFFRLINVELIQLPIGVWYLRVYGLEVSGRTVLLGSRTGTYHTLGGYAR